MAAGGGTGAHVAWVVILGYLLGFAPLACCSGPLFGALALGPRHQLL